MEKTQNESHYTNDEVQVMYRSSNSHRIDDKKKTDSMMSCERF